MAENKSNPFNFDAADYLANRTLSELPTATPIEEDTLVTQARGVVSDMLSGELSDSVADEIGRKAAEGAIIGGITGPAARAFELRDLGLSMQEQQEKGLERTAQFEQLRMAREQANRDNQIQIAQLEEARKEAEDNFAVAMTSASQNQAQIALAALELQSRNRQTRIGYENELIIANAREEIPGVQGNMDSLAGAFDDFNRQAQLYIDI